MTGDSQVQQRIIEKAEELFLKFGVTKVTVDEIATELGISKKTLYKYFDSKESLLQEVMAGRRMRIQTGINEIIHSTGDDFVEKLAKLMIFIGAQFSQATPQFLQNLRKTAPHICREVEQDRNTYALDAFRALSNEGVEEGYIRSDINIDFVAVMYVSLVQGLMHSEAIAQLPMTVAQIYNAIHDVIFFGMFTEKGRTKMEVIRQKENTNAQG